MSNSSLDDRAPNHHGLPNPVIYNHRAPHRAEYAVAECLPGPNCSRLYEDITVIGDEEHGPCFEVEIVNDMLLIRLTMESDNVRAPDVLMESSPLPIYAIKALLERRPAPPWEAKLLTGRYDDDVPDIIE